MWSLSGRTTTGPSGGPVAETLLLTPVGCVMRPIATPNVHEWMWFHNGHELASAGVPLTPLADDAFPREVGRTDTRAAQ